MSSDRLQHIHYSPVTDCPNWVALLGVVETAKHPKFEIFSIFDSKTWLFLFLSLVLVVIFNIKFSKNQNLSITIVMSLINHLECLISKSGKDIFHSEHISKYLRNSDNCFS